MSAVSAARRRLRLRGTRVRGPLVRISRRRLRLLAAISVLAALVFAGGWFLLRDSAVVAVDHVTITGESGSEAGAIREALYSAARTMTTLDFQTARLRTAVAQFPEVKGLRVTTQFPHGIVIHVIELLPIGAVKFSGGETAVTGDGTLVPKVPVTGSLPLIPLTARPIGGRLQEGWALEAARLLAAAPPRLLSRLVDVMTVAGHGLVAQVRNGPSVYFGDTTDLAAKWTAAVAVLADPGSQGASYIDVTDPSRPAAGVDTAVSSAAAGSSNPTGTSAGTGASSSASGSTAAGSTSTSTDSTAQTTSGQTTDTGAGTTSSTGVGTTASTGAVTGASTTPTGG